MTKSLLKSSFEYTSSDAKILRLRWIRPEDKDRIADAVSMMSDESLYRRFFMPIKKLSDQQLEFLTNVDQVNHIAWGLLDESCPTIPGLGIARFVREADEPYVAEAAVTVPDQYQGCGYGTLLLAVLNHSARSSNIKILRSYVLAENTALVNSLKNLGGIASPQQDNIIQIDLPVYENMHELPEETISPRYRKYLLELDGLMFE